MSENNQIVFPKYVLVQFVKRGRKNKVRPVDIVPFIWVDYDKSKDRLSVLFIEDVSIDEDIAMLNQLVKADNSIAAPNSWPFFTVQLLG